MIAPLEIEAHDDVVLVRAMGDIDITTANSVRDGCLAAMTNDCTALVVDLSRSGYLDSAGVRALFTIAARLDAHRQRLALVVPPDSPIRRVLAIVGIESGASVDETTDGALARVRSLARRGAPDA